MERHLSTGVATIVALMAAHRAAACEREPEARGCAPVGGPQQESSGRSGGFRLHESTVQGNKCHI